MKKASITGLALLLTIINTPSVSANQEISSDQTNEMNVNLTVNPTYTISIPADIHVSTPASFDFNERELSNFEVKATDVAVPDGSYVEVLVHTKDEYQNKGNNALVNEDGQYLDFNFDRIDGANYGFSETEKENGIAGLWKVAEFHPIISDKHTDVAPVSLMTDDILVHSGDYKSTLIFDITLIENNIITEQVETPFEEVETRYVDTLPEGEEKVIQEARPQIVEVFYRVEYRDGEEINREETDRRVIQEGQNKIVEIGTGIITTDNVVDFESTPNTKVVEQEDNTMYAGTYEIIQESKPKIEEIIYEVTYKDGVEVSRTEVSRSTTQESQHEIRKVGTMQPTALSHFTWESNGADTVAITSYSDSGPTDVIIPREIDGKLVTEIGESAFRMNDYYFDDSWNMVEETEYRNKSLTSVTIPDTVTHIGDYAFKGAEQGFTSSLNKIHLPNSVTHIGDSAFNSLMINEFKWSENLKYIGSNAFSYNVMGNLQLPNSITEINDYAFFMANISQLKLPSNLVRMGTGAFSNNQFTSVVIPNKLKVIPETAFSVTSLNSITIPDSVERIEFEGFSSTQLTSVTIGSDTIVVNGAFDDNVTINRR